MAKTTKARLDQAGLAGLGTEKLVEILLDEAATNKGLKTRLLTALAGTAGAEQVARLLDKQLDMLGNGRSRLSASKANNIANDLRGLLKTITSELAALDRHAAFEMSLKATIVGYRIEERAYNGGARLAKVLGELNDALVDQVHTLDEAEQLRSVTGLEAARAADEDGRLDVALKAILCGMRKPAADAWKAVLRDKLRAPSGGAPAWRSTQPIAFLQALASSQGDVDAYVDLELRKPEGRRDTLSIAQMLHGAKRHAEALDWVRRPSAATRVIHFGRYGVGLAPAGQPIDLQRQLEADILEAMKQKEAAQAIRWTEFERTLRTDILRTYIARLDDFAEFEEMDRAVAVAAASPRIDDALSFLVQWPRLDLAAAHVLRHAGKWDGRQHALLLPAAQALEECQPAAATMLYRALIDDSLQRALSVGYASAASWLATLHQLQSKRLGEEGADRFREYVADLQKKHARKHGFWEHVPRDLL